MRQPANHSHLWIRQSAHEALALALGLSLFLSFSSHGAEQSPGDVLTPAEREKVFQVYFDRMTAIKPLTRFESRQEWLAYREHLRPKVLQAIGLSPLPDRLPLSPKITGRIERDDYSVERVYFQVFPSVYASGYLYRPTRKPTGAGPAGEGQARLSAVLNPHGHWSLGAVDPVVQSRCIGLAKKGYVAFCPDSTHVAELGYGLCPIGLMTWNNIRALDYLESLDFVDPTRIGCTGASGGAQQAMYLAALDDRVSVIVPAVLVSYFQKILFVSEQTHCFCNHAPGIARVTDETELAAMFAPRPTRFICATGDWTRKFPKEEYPEIRHVFTLMNGEADCVQFDKPHNYDRDSREQMYGWMNKYLRHETDPVLAQEPVIAPEDPEKLKALSQPIPGASDLEGARAFYRSAYGFRVPEPQNLAGWRAYQQQLRADLGEVLGAQGSVFTPIVTSRGRARVQGLDLEKLLLETEPAITVPAWLLSPGASGRRPALVLVHPEGKRALLDERGTFVRSLLDRGIIVLALDPRLRGELRRNWHWNEVIWGRPEEGMAAHDLNSAAAYLRSRKDVDPRQVWLLGLGEAGRFALFAAALDSSWAGVALDETGPLYKEAGPLECIPNLLRFGDLPQIASLAAPGRLWLNGANSRFGFAESAYKTLKHADALTCSDMGRGTFEKTFPQWFKK